MMRSNAIWRRAALGCLSLILSVLSLPQDGRAQVLYGSVVGNVTDPSGAAVSNATVAIKHKETNITREATTDEAGAYHFSAVQTGPYEMRVTMAGFKTVTKADVPVTLNNVTRVDVRMQLGEVSENVTITAETPLLQTDRAEVRAELSETTLKNLPVPLGRNYQNLFKLIITIYPTGQTTAFW